MTDTRDQFWKTYLQAGEATPKELVKRRVQALTAKAVTTLEDLLGRKDSPSVRLGAARTVVEVGIHQHDAEHILHKLDEIEASQRQGSGS